MWATAFASKYIVEPLEKLLALFWTFFYHEMLKRTTIEPLMAIAREEDPDQLRSLFREWSQVKSNESTYIQIAASHTCVSLRNHLLICSKGGFLFTSVTSCLQWNSIERSHWSVSALFYSSLLFSLVAVISGSQQNLVLPREKFEKSQNDDKQDLDLAVSVQEKIRGRSLDGLNSFYVYALQTPIMLLSFSVMTFLAGLCSVIFSPLTINVAWNSDAKVKCPQGVRQFTETASIDCLDEWHSRHYHTRYLLQHISACTFAFPGAVPLRPKHQ